MRSPPTLTRSGHALRRPVFAARRAASCVAGGALALVLGGCTSILGDGYDVSPGDGGHDVVDSGRPVADAGEAGRRDGARADARDTGASDPEGGGVDACAALATLSSKASFESNLCDGLLCTASSNAQLQGNALCVEDAGTVTCSLPAYVPPDAGLQLDAQAPDAGAPKDAAPDAPAHDSGPSLPKCSAPPPLAGGFTYPPTTLYAIGSTAIQPYVARLAQLFAAGVNSTADGGARTAVTIVYAGAGSCVGVQAAYAPAGQTLPPISALATTATYYDPALDAQGNPVPYTCALDSDAPADLGISDVFPSSCSSLPFTAPIDPLPAPYYDFFGPVQVMEMLVPVSSPATSITYEEAGLVWGYGSAAHVEPWLDPDFLFKRSATSGTQTMISLAVGLDPRVWVGVPEASSSAVRAALIDVQTTGLPDGGVATDPAANAAKTMGILASDVADGMRQSARPLAFQDRLEGCAWLPDSSLATFDKQNVRDGHYPIWGPSHFLTTVDSSFLPKPTVAKLIAALSGTDADVGRVLDVVQLYATSHVIPTCAMHVTRTSDGASYAYYQPPGKSACSCYYDDQVPLDATTCTPCSVDADCSSAGQGATSCNVYGLPPKGYCEVPGP